VTILIVGAGPTGLTLAGQLQALGTEVRLIDRSEGPVRESRALAIQPRTLEILARLEITDQLVERGSPAVGVDVHVGRRTVKVPLFDIGADDTAYPFLLFLSQAETEGVLDDHLARGGLTVERGRELVGLHTGPDQVICSVRTGDGGIDTIEADYVVGCDGAHSAVRHHAGIAFTGSAYPQTFALADLDADGLEPGAAHAYLSDAGMLFFFPLVRPAAWRLLAMRPPGNPSIPQDDHRSPSRHELQALADSYTTGTVRLRDPIWATWLRIHLRHASAYRSGRVFLAGDAAHIHSPAGAQGMNTGIQDAWNLGWKLALVADGIASPELLDTYQTERMPIGREVLRLTDRAFKIATSAHPVIRFARRHIAPHLLTLAARSQRGRASAMRRLGQLDITYRDSPAVHDGTPPRRHGPQAGDRLPDATIRLDNTARSLHDALASLQHHLLLTGPAAAWPEVEVAALAERYQPVIRLHRLTRHPAAGSLHDPDGTAHRRLGIDQPGATAHHLIRPDGHLTYRSAGNNLAGLHAHIARWLPGMPTRRSQ
jgi:2-polyprenyl-6-methoxyphenol hydroxylase-like FAD-dependent oxidoreductase